MDLRSPLRNITRWLDVVLLNLSKGLNSSLHDSKQLLCWIHDKKITIEPEDWLVTSDIVEFFPNIQIPDLQRVLQIAFLELLGPNVALQNLVRNVTVYPISCHNV